MGLVTVSPVRLRLRISWLVRRSAAAKLLQKWVRRSHIKRLRSKARKASLMATKIQSLYRGVLARRSTSWLRFYWRTAKTIQRVYRYARCSRVMLWLSVMLLVTLAVLARTPCPSVVI